MDGNRVAFRGDKMKVSIITVVKSHADGLKETFDSLLNQNYDDWEMIIVCGESEDDTLSVAFALSEKHARVFLVQQRDVGIYDAMNEGINAATGGYLWFMNAGDRFFSSNTLSNAMRIIIHYDLDLLIGGYQIGCGDNSTSYSYPEKQISKFLFAFNRRSSCHQSMIFKSKTVRNFNGYDTKYTLASDFDLALSVVQYGAARRMPEIYSEIEPGGRADREIFKVHREKHLIRISHFRNPLVTLISLLWTSLARVKINFRHYVSN